MNKLIGVALLALMAQLVAAQPAPPAGSPPGADSPRVDAISFSGNMEFSSAALALAIQLKPGDTLSRDKVKGDLARIVTLYRHAGYNLSVSPNISHPAPGHVAIEFKIDEKGTGGDTGPAAAPPLPPPTPTAPAK